MVCKEREKREIEKIPKELKKGVPLEEQQHNQNLRWSLKTPWISKSSDA
jgi:hypothetical protein